MDEDLKDLQPVEWSDDTRMAALFGKYRPDHFDFWYPLIYETSRRLNTFTFSIKDLKKRFKRKGLVPIGFAKLFVRVNYITMNFLTNCPRIGRCSRKAKICDIQRVYGD
jgi:hypothetical protein